MSDRWQFPSVGLTIGGRNRDLSGYLHVGRDRSGPELYGTLLVDRDQRGRLGRQCYPRGHYYHLYYPIHYFGRDYDWPWNGYTYTSLYYHEPRVYRFYNNDVYYVDNGEEPAEVAVVEGPEAGPVIENQPEADGGYQVLTQPDDDTLVGRGNAAFMAGSYEDARRYYVSAVLADERDGYAKFLYSVVNFATGDFDVAGMALRRALLTTPELIEYPPDVRRLYAEVEVLDAQLSALTRFVNKHPADSNARLLLGYLLLTRGRASEAVQILATLADADDGDQLAVLLRDAIVRIQADREMDD